MKTTIQINEKTLALLRKLKEQNEANSYDETIEIIINKQPKKSMAGSLKRYMKKGEKLSDILRNLRNEDDRY
jgi:predicted CopG family antitoxin